MQDGLSCGSIEDEGCFSGFNSVAFARLAWRDVPATADCQKKRSLISQTAECWADIIIGSG